ncbi:hypothetical protein HAX54_001125 [Datura stramonium]|uniref:Uncharacterized protein n=1 Tax=Datura stramonium TaxID=4076 RepID=A0ABS8RTX8_DATST|nr:hypothetical protein [Datura stramonium]
MSLIHLKPPYHGHPPPLRHHKLTFPKSMLYPFTLLSKNCSQSGKILVSHESLDVWEVERGVFGFGREISKGLREKVDCCWRCWVYRITAEASDVADTVYSLLNANNAESCESKKFQSLAFADLSATMGKKKLKAFIPQLLQAIYFGILFTFTAGTLLVSKGSFDCSAICFFCNIPGFVDLTNPGNASIIGRIMFL